MNIDKYKKELDEKGYTIIPNVLNNDEIEEYKREFNKWLNNVPDLREFHSKISFGGIFKFHQVGQQRFTWLIRTNPKVQEVFKKLWNTDELVTGFDGCCYYPKDYDGENRFWVHTDQSSHKKGVYCYQSFVSLTDNEERTLMVYDGSNLIHEKYFEDMNIDCPRDWNILDEGYVAGLEERKRILKVNAGDLVLWESRTFHQNVCGNKDSDEERLIQYICFLPKDRDGNDNYQQEYRRYCFETKRTTSHWPYPISVVPEQPLAHNAWLNEEEHIIIDNYSLPKPELDDLKEEIEKLL